MREAQGDQQLIWQLQQTGGSWQRPTGCVSVCVCGGAQNTGTFWLLQESRASVSLGVGGGLGNSKCDKQKGEERWVHDSSPGTQGLLK